MRNKELLTQNGRVFWLQRDISLLPKEGRPLSLSSDLAVMYEKRKPMYQDFSDWAIDNNGSQDDCANAILKLWEECL